MGAATWRPRTWILRGSTQPPTRWRDSGSTLRILYPIRNKKSAIELNEQGERLLFTYRSTINPANIVPVTRGQSLNDLRTSVALFERALADDPAYAKAAFNLGQARQLVGDQDKSLVAYQTALQINPSFVDARIQYAAVLLESGDTDEAIRQLTEARRLDASNDELYAMLARAFHARGAWSNAVESADDSLRLNNSNAMAHLWRADALRCIAADEKMAGDRSRNSIGRHARDMPHRAEGRKRPSRSRILPARASIRQEPDYVLSAGQHQS